MHVHVYLYVDIIHFACNGQKYTAIKYTLLTDYVLFVYCEYIEVIASHIKNIYVPLAVFKSFYLI